MSLHPNLWYQVFFLFFSLISQFIYDTRGSFYHHGLNAMPRWIRNNMPIEVCGGGGGVFFQNFNCTVEVYSSHYDGCNYLSILEFNLSYVSKLGPKDIRDTFY